MSLAAWFLLCIVVVIGLYYVIKVGYFSNVEVPKSKMTLSSLPSVRVSGTNVTDNSTVLIALERAGSDELTANITTWNSNNVTGAPDNDETLLLTGCKSSADGNILSAVTKYMLFHPTVSITLESLTDTTALAKVTITDAWPENSTNSYSISGLDYAGVSAFIKSCSFPVIE